MLHKYLLVILIIYSTTYSNALVLDLEFISTLPSETETIQTTMAPVELTTTPVPENKIQIDLRNFILNLRMQTKSNNDSVTGVIDVTEEPLFQKDLDSNKKKESNSNCSMESCEFELLKFKSNYSECTSKCNNKTENIKKNNIRMRNAKKRKNSSDFKKLAIQSRCKDVICELPCYIFRSSINECPECSCPDSQNDRIEFLATSSFEPAFRLKRNQSLQLKRLN